MSRYISSQGEAEVLPNLLGLTRQEELHNAEFEGFLMAEILFTENLTAKTRFNVKYICDIHYTALKSIYTFAGKFRTVNISKGGFLFPASRFIPENMQNYEHDILSLLPNKYNDKNQLIKDVARAHGELLFIHPFREGNGRTARIFANLMVRKHGYQGLNFNKIKFNDYIIAVQQCAGKNYKFMEKLIASAF